MKIGILGPQKQVRKVLSAVQKIEDASFVPFEYTLPQKAPMIVSEKQKDLDAIFFCGFIPYCLCLNSVPRSIPWDYLRLNSTGLLIALINAHRYLNDKVRMSVDILSEMEIREGLEDCSLNIEAIYTHSFDLSNLDLSITNIVDFHSKLLSEGKVNICLTCIDAVHKELLNRNLPVYRISPGKQTIRSAVERLKLEVRGQSNSLLLSVVGIFRPDSNFDDRRQFEDAMFKLNTSLVAYTKKRGILLIPRNHLSYQTIETMGQFLMETANLTNVSFLSKIMDACDFDVVAGFGVGPNLKIAEEYAAKALDMGKGSKGTFYIFDGKRSLPLGVSSEISLPFTNFNYDSETIMLSERLNISVTTLTRYILGLMYFEGAFTTSEFAKVVSLQPKSARKVLKKLQNEMLIRECGILAHAGKGRPQRLFLVTEKAAVMNSQNLIPGGEDKTRK